MEKNIKKGNLKNSIKEITIFLLWTLAVILILGVLLYQYVPMNKIIPETISYTTPEDVKAELQSENNTDGEGSEDSTLPLEYKIDSTELSNYKKTQEYVPGKKNPFATVTQNDSQSSGNETTINTNSGSNTSSSSGSTTNINSGNTSTGNSTNGTTNSSNYLPDKGTK